MIERPGTPPPSQEPPGSPKKSPQSETVRLFGYEIKLGYVGKKLVVVGRGLRKVGRKLISDRLIEIFYVSPKVKPGHRAFVRSESPVLVTRPEDLQTNPEVLQAKRSELQLKNGAQSIEAMNSLVMAIEAEDVAAAVHSLYDLRQSLALKTTLEGRESFDVTDLMEHARSALDSVALDARGQERLSQKGTFLAELMALLRVMDAGTHQGELISSVISKSASGCLIRPNPLLIIQEKLFPDFDLLAESEKVTAANIDPGKINLCFATLKNCRTRLEEEADNLVDCMKDGAVERLPEQVDHLMEASVETIREQAEEISFERIKAYMKKNIWSMVIPDGVNQHLRNVCQQKESRLLQYMAAVQELAFKSSGNELADFRIKAAKELNDLICRQLDLGEEDEPEELVMAQKELWQLTEVSELSGAKASRKIFLEGRIQELINEKESRGRSLVHLERMSVKASPEMVEALRERFEQPLKFDLFNEAENGFE
ncbi:hypothetical protein [Endozoicomonas arenosclerae]|uniref:hypothetical protein n=1 Tax=Endozoicomonas arenosclerae TaxID=1633495 RepID=UPI00078196A6|nr:hypothetical protein [Endozoicomonas arenosclerae]